MTQLRARNRVACMHDFSPESSSYIEDLSLVGSAGSVVSWLSLALEHRLEAESVILKRNPNIPVKHCYRSYNSGG